MLAEEPVHADAMVWLQGNRYARGARTLELFLAGYAPTIVLTGNDTRLDEAHADDGVHVTIADLRRWLCERGVPPSVIIADSTAMHTRDQAVHVLAMAQERRWTALLLVASPHHQSRAFLTFLKRAHEIGWDGRIVNQPARIPWDAVPSGRWKTSAACYAEEVEKIMRSEHVATPLEGLAALDSAQHCAHTKNV